MREGDKARKEVGERNQAQEEKEEETERGREVCVSTCVCFHLSGLNEWRASPLSA